ncbi:MAG: hypothetical protein HQ481_18620 [Alphaproteobacteria bacterium]|nr:hypothetical protein [Alphaproteobacteria bacterium]
MASKESLTIIERLAPFAGAAATNPLGVFREIARVTVDAAARQRRALDTFQTHDDTVIEPGNEAWLLNALHSPVPFEFRDAEIDEFKEWFYDTTDERWLKWRLLTGGPGRGKTRFVHEWIKQLEGENSGTVIGGFVNANTIAANPDALSGFLDVKEDVIFAVDYAERFRDVVAWLLHASIAMRNGLKKNRERRIRVVLISRKQTETWDGLRVDYPMIERFLSSLAGGLETVPLSPIAEALQDRQTAFDAAFRAFDEHLRHIWREGKPTPLPSPRPDFSDTSFEDALLIHLAALAIWHEGEGIEPISRDSLLRWLLDRERRAWNRCLDDRRMDSVLKPHPIEQAAVLLTFVSLGGQGIQDRSRAIELLGTCPLLAGETPATISAIADIFRELYPGPAWVNGVTPDLLGQYLLAIADDEFLDAFDDATDEN